MNTLLRAALVAAMLATPLAAQDTATATEDTATQDAAPAADAPAAEPMATEPGDAAAAATGETIVAVHKDWQIRCLPENTACYMYQLAIDAREAPVAEMSVVALDQGEVVAGFTIMTPLRTFLPAGVQVQIDNGRVQRYQFEICAEQGCVVRFGVPESGLNQFRNGNKVRLTVVSAENKDAPVILDVSLQGFTAAMEELKGLN